MAGPYGATHVPFPFDVVIDGHGYRLYDALETLPYGLPRSSYGISPTFLPRTNVSGDYGDNQHDFWMIFTQRDWSLGEGQRYFRSADEEAVRRFFQGTKLNVGVSGQVTLRDEVNGLSAAANVTAMGGSAERIWFATATNLYSIIPTTGTTDHGAHSLNQGCLAIVDDESGDVYVGGPSSSGDTIRKWNGAAFSSFAATALARDLSFINNTVFSVDSAELSAYDSAGVRSAKHAWKGGDGANVSDTIKLIQSGGQIAIMRQRGETGGTELYEYNGTGVSLTAPLPLNFQGYDLGVFYGVTFVAGRFLRSRADTKEYLPAIIYYAAGTIGLLWAAEDWTTSDVTVCCTQFNNLMVFNDPTRSVLMAYNLDTGGVSAFAAYTGSNGTAPLIAASRWYVAFAPTSAGTTINLYPDDTVAASGTLTTSLYDGDSSLQKHFHTVVVDYDEATDGDGGSVDVAYRLENLNPGGAFTTLQTGIVSGTEYDISQNANSISIRLTLNKGTSTKGPAVKRIKVRAAPILDSFRRATYVLDLTGRNGDGMIPLRDGTTHAKDGHEMGLDLLASAQLNTPITVIDRYGSFDAIIDTEGFELMEVHPEEYVAVCRVRGT